LLGTKAGDAFYAPIHIFKNLHCCPASFCVVTDEMNIS